MLHSVAHATLSLRCIKVSREKSCNVQGLLDRLVVQLHGLGVLEHRVREDLLKIKYLKSSDGKVFT